MDGESKRRVKQSVVILLLVMVFIYLIGSITVTILKIYNQKESDTKVISEESSRYGSLSFEVLADSVAYDGSNLSFSVQNRIGEPFEHLIVDIGRDSFTFVLVDFISGSDPQEISLQNVLSVQEFTTYPEGCPKLEQVIALP